MAMRKATFLYAGAIMTSAPWRLGPQTHDHHELIVILTGRLRLRLNGRDILAREGDVLLYRNGEAHEEESDPAEPFHSCFVGFTDSGLPECIPSIMVDSGGRLRQLARWLGEEREGERVDVEMARQGFFQALMGELMRLATDPEIPMIRQVRTYVRHHLHESIMVDDLAAHVGISKFHFIRLYRAATGCTPMADVRRMRLESARDLVLSTNLSFKIIADHCGLGTASHFSHVFNKHFGLCPGRFRVGVAERSRI